MLQSVAPAAPAPAIDAEPACLRSYVRWECHCERQPVLLGSYVPSGLMTIKYRGRFYWLDGAVRAVCPRGGAVHELDPRSKPAAIVRPPMEMTR